MTHPESFSSRLLAWYHQNKRPMPWRETRAPYRIWLSEVMLQQTQVATVIPYYTRFLSHYPTLNDLADARDEDVLKLWEGLGYYRRCHNFLKAVRILAQTHQGEVPDDPVVFKSLPGVGDYTTAAVMSIAFGQKLPVMDGNVIRVIARYHCIADDSTKNATRKTILTWMEGYIPSDQPGDFNQSVMELGATVCLPKNPLCGECPIKEGCCAGQSEKVTAYPVIPKKEKIPEYSVGLAVIQKGKTFLIQNRPPTGHLAGMWELPGGKAEKNEDVKAALSRKCLEELGVSLCIGERIARVSHVYSHFRIRVSVFLCSIKEVDATSLKQQPLKWITVQDLDQYAFPSANHKFFKALIDKIG